MSVCKWCACEPQYGHHAYCPYEEGHLAGQLAMRERAAQVATGVPNNMSYGLGVEDSAIASIENSINSIKDEIATAIRALTPEGPTG